MGDTTLNGKSQAVLPIASDLGSPRNAGALWVDRYLLPIVRARMPGATPSALRCVQVQPENEDEARRLREHGFVCDVVRLPANAAAALPVIPAQSGRYDLVVTGAFGALANTPARRAGLASEFARVCRPGGAVLLVIGNSRCPVDLSGTAPRLHFFRDATTAALPDLSDLFLSHAGFASITALSLAGMFGWSSHWAAVSLATRALSRYLAFCSRPDRPLLYASPWNPVLSLWIAR